MCIELKIKEKHLALEPAIIKAEEQNLQSRISYLYKSDDEVSRMVRSRLIAQLGSLSKHRSWNVRNEARATHLARHFLAGKDYKLAESRRGEDREWVFKQHIVPRILAMISKYDPRHLKTYADIEKWAAL